MYLGNLRQIRIASFSMLWRRESWDFGAARKAMLPYSMIGRTYILYIRISVAASVPLRESTFRTFSLVLARLQIESTWFLKDKFLSISTPRNFAHGTGLITSLNRWRAWFSPLFSRVRAMRTSLDLSPFNLTRHLRHHPSRRLRDFWSLYNAKDSV